MILMEKFIDPVCGMEVDPSQAYGRVKYGKHVIYFCSKVCQEKFMKNLDKYISKISTK
ncbi:MAG: YHS domain-containing protein [Candidatus Methanomethylicia archaeon]